jgi:hypothetical protein
MVAWSRRGPGHAVVDDVQVTEEPPEGADGFRVR